MSDFEDMSALDDSASGLNETLAKTSHLVSGFDSELRRMRTSLAATGKDMSTLEKGLGRGLRRAFDGVVFDGLKLSDALKTVATSLANTAYSAAIRPVTAQFGGMLAQGVGNLVGGILPFADGAAFSQGKVMPFANGGVVSGTGGGVSVVMNITTPDVQGFQRSRSQIAAQMTRALSMGERNR